MKDAQKFIIDGDGEMKVLKIWIVTIMCHLPLWMIGKVGVWILFSLDKISLFENLLKLGTGNIL